MFPEALFPAYRRLSRVSRSTARRTTERGQLFQTGAVLCTALGIDTDLTLIYQLFALCIAIIIVSRLSLRIHQPNVTLVRHLPRFGTVGEPFVYYLRLTNAGDQVENGIRLVDNPMVRTPTAAEFQAEKEPFEETRNAYDRKIGFHRYLYLQRKKTGIATEPSDAPPLGRRAAIDVSVKATPVRRGIVTLASISVLHPDPIGLNYGVQDHAIRDDLLVLPKRYVVPASFNLPGGRHLQPGGVNAAFAIGESDEFVSLRDYRDGDPVRKIHWASSAKRDTPVVKEYQDEFYVRQALVLDTCTESLSVLEEAVSVAASFAMRLDSADGLLDLIFFNDKPQFVTTGRGFSDASQQLAALATIRANNAPFDDTARVVIAHAPRICGCILVLAKWDDERQALMQRLEQMSVPVVCLVVGLEQPDVPAGVHGLTVGNIEAGLAVL